MDDTQSNVLDQTDLIDHEKVAKHKLRQKRSRWWLLVALVVVVVGYVAVMYVRNKDVYARIGDVVVTKAEFQSARNFNDKVAKLTHNESVLKDVDNYTKNQLLLEASLSAEAKKYNVPISNNDIEEQILSSNQDAKKMDSAEDTIRNFEMNHAVLYGVNSDSKSILRSLRIEALKKKLASNILAYRSVLMIATRWDVYVGDGSTDLNASDALAKETLRRRVVPLLEQNSSDDTFEKLAQDTAPEQPGAVNPMTIIVTKLPYLNQDNKNTTGFQDPKDWDSVNSLDKVGSYTDITKSEGGGYYYIMRLGERGTGSFNTWADYEKVAANKAVIYGTGWSWRSMLAYNQSAPQFAIDGKSDGLMCLEDNPKGLLSRWFDSVLSVGTARAVCNISSVGTNHMVSFGGRIINGAGQPLSGVRVTVTPRYGDEGICPYGDPTSTSPREYYTDGAGHWRSARTFSCYMSWKVQLSLGSCTYETNVILQSGANGIDARDQDIVFNCIPNQKGWTQLENWTIDSSGNRVRGRIPTPAGVSYGVNTCLADMASGQSYGGLSTCMLNGFDFSQPGYFGGVSYRIIPADSLSYRVHINGDNGWNSPPTPDPGWIFDHIEVEYPCAGMWRGPMTVNDSGAAGTVPNIIVPSGNCNGGATVIVRTFYRQALPPAVKLTIDSNPTPPSLYGSNPSNPYDLPADLVAPAAQLDWVVTGLATNCTASGDWSGLKNVTGGSESRAADSNADYRLATYTITCSGPGGVSTDSVYVRYRRQFLPWLQTKRGDVMVTSKITGQLSGKNGGRNTSNDSTKEAEYVIMSLLSKDFCSVKGYAFGKIDNNQASCSNETYAPKVSNGSDIIDNLNKFAGSDISSCAMGADQPYQVASSGLPSGGVINDQSACGKIWKVSGASSIGGYTVNRGTATLWVNGNLTITGNITNNFSGSYNGYLTPGLGIIVAGDITIDPSVTRIDATLFATGKINTCSAYPNQACSNKLTVNGMVGAQNGFELGRNYFESSGPNRSSNVPAELFAGAAQNIVLPLPGFEDRITSTSTGLQYLTGELNPQF